MYRYLRCRGRRATCLGLLGLLSACWGAGCARSSSLLASFGSPFTFVGGGGTTGGGVSGGAGSDLFGGGGRTSGDPCAEPLNRKFIRISMRNLDPTDFVHYFLVLIAFVSGETYPDGAVCPDDVDLYTTFGYTEIPEGTAREFGNLCVVGPALLYFHEAGQFRRAGGATGTQLASAIAPAQGTSPSFDNFFDSAGAQVPVPDLIVFHNPGSGDGAALKISRNDVSPCDPQTAGGDPACDQDAFYYVDDIDLLAGSTATGLGSGRRIPSEIQDTACECLGFDEPWHALAPPGVSASSVRCNEFLRGGRIEYVFIREDTNPPIPQLLWRVTDASGAVAHDFDPAAPIP